MITKFNTFINESLLDNMKGKSDKEIWKSFGFDMVFNDPIEFYDLFLKNIRYYLDDFNNRTYAVNDTNMFFYNVQTKKVVVYNSMFKYLTKIFLMESPELEDYLKEYLSNKYDLEINKCYCL